MSKIIPILLCGGMGTRLKPLTTNQLPKQFLPIYDSTLFEQSYARIDRIRNELNLGRIHILTTRDLTPQIEDHTSHLKGKSKPVIIAEPSAKNTYYPITISSILIERINKSAHLLFLPSDHLILNQNKLKQSLINAIELIDGSDIIIFGKRPTSPSTSYGYINVVKKSRKVSSFEEKPNLSKAKFLIKSGAFWNSGMFLIKTNKLNSLTMSYHPRLFDRVKKYGPKKLVDFKPNYLNENIYRYMKKRSFDNEVLSNNIKYNLDIKMISLLSDWSDLGTWNSLIKFLVNYDTNKNTRDKYKEINYSNKSNSIKFHSFKKNKIFSLLFNDYIFHGIYDELQNINILSIKKAIKEREYFRKPWGSYLVMYASKKYKLKLLKIKPSQSISLQYHKKRNENWIILKGRGLVEISNKSNIVEMGNQVSIPSGVSHRIRNIDKNDLVIYEIQTGMSFDEKDIIRIEDKYGRC
jgi:mannose-1-phosphate guanylyltransferase